MLSFTSHFRLKLSVEKTSDQPVSRTIEAFGRSVINATKKWITNIQNQKNERRKSKNVPSTSSFILLSESKTFPLLTLQLYEPESFVATEVMLYLLPDKSNLLPSLYHRYVHPEETLTWQLKDTESSECIKLCAGFCSSVTVGASEGW